MTGQAIDLSKEIFNMAGATDPLSVEWRVATSTHPPVELALALRAVGKVIGHVTQEDVTISFSQGGESYYNSENKHIVIDAKYALDSYPIDPDKFDVLVGLAAHEGAHSTLGSGSVYQHRVKLNTGETVNVSLLGEEIWCDTYLKYQYPQLAKYLRKSRTAYNRELPNYNSVAEIFTYTGIYGNLVNTDMFAASPVSREVVILLEMAAKLNSAIMYTMAPNVPQIRENIYNEAAIALRQLQSQKSQEEAESYQEKEPPLELEEYYESGGGKTTIQMDKDGKAGEVQPDNEEEDNNEQDEDPQGDSEPSDQTPEQADDQEGEPSPPEDDDDSSADGEGEPNPPGEEPDAQEEPFDLPDQANNSLGQQLETLLDSLSEAEVDDGSIEQAIKDLFQPEAREVDGRTNDNKGEINDFHHRTPISEQLMEAIKDATELETEDMLPSIKDTFGELTGVHRISESVLWNKPPKNSEFEEAVNDDLAKSLAWIKELKNARGKRTLRNEEHGVLDAQRLYRAGINGLIYKRKKQLPQGKRKIVLLLDASGSMSGHTSVYVDAHTVVRIVGDCEVISYRAWWGSFQMNEHRLGQRMTQVNPDGGTPSGWAIMSCAIKYPEHLIIHFTDGMPNNAPLPAEVIPTLNKTNPELKLVNVLYRASALAYPEKEWSRNILLREPKQFGEELKSILREWSLG